MYVPYISYTTSLVDERDKHAIEDTKFSEISLHKKSGSRNSLQDKSIRKVGSGNALSFFNNLFRSKSDSEIRKSKVDHYPVVKSKKSSKSSPASCPARRRKFVRVVRDDEAKDEEYVNPHVTRHYSKNYWEQRNREALSESPPLPYTVPGTTILKKQASDDIADSPSSKHAYFKPEVDIVFYDKKEKCSGISLSSVSREKLQDMDISYDYDSLIKQSSNTISCSDLDSSLSFELDDLDNQCFGFSDELLDMNIDKLKISHLNDSFEQDVFENSSVKEFSPENSHQVDDVSNSHEDFLLIMNNDQIDGSTHCFNKISRKLSYEEYENIKKTKTNADYFENCNDRCS